MQDGERVQLSDIMRNIKKLLLVIAAVAGSVAAMAQVSFGHPVKFNDDWRFILSDSTAYSQSEFADSAWRKLSVPHDWSIEGQISPSLASCTGYLPGGIGWYRKHFNVADTLSKHYIYFEGVYNRSDVYLNGKLLGKRPNGYASFMYDLTSALKEGDNVLAVRVDHSKYADSRWYTGSGIYRDVYLVSAPETHIAQWGIGYELLKSNKKQAKVKVDLAVENPTGKELAKITVLNPAGKKVADATVSKLKTENELNINIPNPQMWNLEDPKLYTLRVELEQNGRKIDEASVKMGLRTLEFSADKGFALNGKNMKVKGVCLHHDA